MNTNDFATIRGALAALRSKIRAAWTTRGLAFTVAAACTAALFSFTLDWFLDLPLAVRAVHLCVMACAVYAVAHWSLVRPLRTKANEADLAQALEHGAPELSDRLVSALDFERRLDDAADPESREMMSAVVGDAALAAARVDPSLLVDARPARRAIAVAAGATLLLCAVALSMPEEFGLWIRRGVLLEDLRWPKRTHLRVLDFPESGPRIVTRGDDLRIVAVADGETPSELQLHYEELSDADAAKGEKPEVTYTDVRRMYPTEGEEGRFAFDFRAVSASFRFWVTGGDDQDEDPVYSVLALVPPRIASISANVHYPAYTGLADAQIPDASFDALKGSHVDLKLTANMPLAGARFVPTDGAATAIALSPDAKTMTISLDVAKSVDFHVELTAIPGQTNRAEEDDFHVRAAEDRPPELRVLYPPARISRTPVGILPLKIVARDDFRVAKLSLDIARGSAPAASTPLWPAEGEKPPADARRVDTYRPLDLRQFAGDAAQEIKAGDVLHLIVRAVDSKGNESASSDISVEILAPEDFERRQGQRQGTLREELSLVRRNQQRTRSAISELRTAAAKATDDASLARGRDLQVDQGRVTNDLVQFLNGVHQVFDAYVLDRVGAVPTIDRLLPLYHEALAKPAENENEVFPASLYKKIVEEKRADRLFDPEVLGALLDIMDLGDRATAELSPAVYQNLVQWAGEGPHDPAQLERAEKLSAELAAKLAELDQRMQRWEDLNVLIDMAREIRSREDTLSKDPGGTRELQPK